MMLYTVRYRQSSNSKSKLFNHWIEWQGTNKNEYEYIFDKAKKDGLDPFDEINEEEY